MRAYDEERGEQAAPISKHDDKLNWQTQVREELEEMNSDDTFYVIIKDSSDGNRDYTSTDFTYHRTYQLALQMITELADELDAEFEMFSETSFYIEGAGGAFVEYYIEEREFND